MLELDGALINTYAVANERIYNSIIEIEKNG